MKELLEPTIEHDDEDDNYGGGEFNDVSAVAVAAVDVAMAAAASKSTIDDDNYHSNDDGDEGSGSSGKCNDTNYEDDDDVGGKCSPVGKELYYSDDDDFLDDIFDDDYIEKHFSSIPDEPACDRNRNRIMGGPQPPGPNATEEEMKSYELKRKAFTDANRCKIMAALSSKFGSCTCGFPRKEGVPCDHMVAIVKQGIVPSITRVELMPFWYTRAQWQLQYPKDVVYKSDMTWANVMKSAEPDLLMKYCPSWAATKKKGRPKKERRKLGIADYVKQGVVINAAKTPSPQRQQSKRYTKTPNRT